MKPQRQKLKRGDLVTLKRVGAPNYRGIVLETDESPIWPSARIIFYTDSYSKEVTVNQNLYGLRKLT